MLSCEKIYTSFDQTGKLSHLLFIIIIFSQFLLDLDCLSKKVSISGFSDYKKLAMFAQREIKILAKNTNISKLLVVVQT